MGDEDQASIATHPEAIDGAGVRIDDRMIPGPHGPIPVRIYQPPNPRAGLVWAHGGAFVFGGLDQAESDWVARRLADEGVAVIAVDYRLAPTPAWFAEATGLPVSDGVHFPAPVDDLTTAFEQAPDLVPSITAGAWSLGGASAGATLAVGTAVGLRGRGVSTPRCLVLAYGLFHAQLPDLSPELAAAYASLPPETAVFTPEVVALIAQNYVASQADLTDPRAFPGGHDLTGLPPAFLLNADLDSLRSSGEAFALELAAAGVDVLLMREPGTLHGYLDNPTDPGALASTKRFSAWLTSGIVR